MPESSLDQLARRLAAGVPRRTVLKGLGVSLVYSLTPIRPSGGACTPNCDPGWKCCSGRCCPANKSCCGPQPGGGSGFCCDENFSCCQDNTCCNPSSMCCGSGSGAGC